jgi:hypothetical protein
MMPQSTQDHSLNNQTAKSYMQCYAQLLMNHSFLTVSVSVEDGTSGGTYGVSVGSSWHAGAPEHDDRATPAMCQPSQTARALWFRNTQWYMDQSWLLPFTGHLPSRRSCQTRTYSQTHVTGCPLIGSICKFNSMCLLALFQFYKRVMKSVPIWNSWVHESSHFLTTHYNQRDVFDIDTTNLAFLSSMPIVRREVFIVRRELFQTVFQ